MESAALKEPKLKWLLFANLCALLLPPAAQYFSVFLLLVYILRSDGIRTLLQTWPGSHYNPKLRGLIQLIGIALVCFFVSAVFSTVFAELINDTEPDWRGVFRAIPHLLLKRMLVWAVLIYGLAKVLKHHECIEIAKPLVYFLALYTVYALLQRYTGIDLVKGFNARLGEHRFAYETFRVSGFMGHPISLSYNLMLMFFFCIACSLKTSITSSQRRWLWIAIGLVISLLLLSGSRWPLAVCVLVLLSSEAPRLAKSWKWVTGGFVAFASLLTLEGTLLSRIAELKQQIGSGGTNIPRIEFWRIHWRIFLEHPWWGTGYASYAQQAATFYENANLVGLNERYNAHNIYLQTLADGGVIAGAGLIGLLAVVVYCGWALRQSTRLLLYVVFCTIWGGMMQNVLRDSTFLYGWSLMIALSFAEHWTSKSSLKVEDSPKGIV